MQTLEMMTEPELKSLMVLMAKCVEGVAEVLNVERPLFCLVLFNDPAMGQYISNCSRDGIVAALRETADRIERKQDVTR